MFNDIIEEKITRAVKNWEETNTGDFNDSSFLSYILILKLLNQIDVTSPADSANLNTKLTDVDNSIKALDTNVRNSIKALDTNVRNSIKALDTNVRNSLSILHNDLVSVEGKLDNIATWLSKVNTGIANSNTLLTQIEAKTK